MAGKKYVIVIETERPKNKQWKVCISCDGYGTNGSFFGNRICPYCYGYGGKWVRTRGRR